MTTEIIENYIDIRSEDVDVYEKRYILHLESNKMAEITLKERYYVSYNDGNIILATSCNIEDLLYGWERQEVLICSDGDIVPVDKIVKATLVEEKCEKETIYIQKYEKITREIPLIKFFTKETVEYRYRRA